MQDGVFNPKPYLLGRGHTWCIFSMNMCLLATVTHCAAFDSSVEGILVCH